MFGSHFYHATVRKSVAVFGTLFNNITVARTKSDGSIINQVKVPLAYGPKQKFLSRLETETGQDASVAIKLPRISFEITGIDIDTSKKLQKRTKLNEPGTTGSTTTRKSIKQFVPYNIGMQLNIMAKNQDDGLQILEQILPYFQPEFTVSIKPVDDFNSFKQDVPIVLNSVSFEDQFEGDYTSRRVLIYTLDFNMKMSFYGPIADSKVIRQVNIDFRRDDQLGAVITLAASTVLPISFISGATIYQGTEANKTWSGIIHTTSDKKIRLNQNVVDGYTTNSPLKVTKDGVTQEITVNNSIALNSDIFTIEEIDTTIGANDTESNFTVTTTIDVTNFE